MVPRQIFEKKMESDQKIDVTPGSKLQSMSDFIVSYFLFKFGTKALVKARLIMLNHSVAKLNATDKLVHLFGRMCNLLVRPAPFSCARRAMAWDVVDVRWWCVQSVLVH